MTSRPEPPGWLRDWNYNREINMKTIIGSDFLPHDGLFAAPPCNGGPSTTPGSGR